MKLIYPTIIGLAVMLAVTGCNNHKPYSVTPLPNSNATPRDPYSQTLPYDNNPPGIRTADINNFDNMAEDHAALAAYTVHFAYDSAAIRKTEQSKLQAVASALSSDPSTKLTIEGNCDERGTEEYNRSLGERRAQAVREALAKLGIDPNRIRTISYGKDKPVDPGHDASAWAKNRRDDFVLLHPKTGV
ncbi:MAG TPA: peptidoglycan-associated lipoprotein Pal [Verrucomicrobiae bacterium]|nr:peptidoglycan-associated lipoprotein Pal [Verrucomicrobiae bacterium]